MLLNNTPACRRHRIVKAPAIDIVKKSSVNVSQAFPHTPFVPAKAGTQGNGQLVRSKELGPRFRGRTDRESIIPRRAAAIDRDRSAVNMARMRTAEE